MTTIKEIAELAGVSTTTVSNVIHGKTKKVSPATIHKVESLIKELGYVQKMGLRVLNKESSQLIAVVINYHKEFRDSILGDPFYGKLIGFIEELVQKHGYYLMIYTAQNIENIFQMVMGWNIDGVIAISFSRKNCDKIYQLIKKPIVSIDAYGERDQEITGHVVNIALDDESGGYEMTRYLLSLGYKNIKVCAGRDNGVDHQRLIGANRALKEHNGSDRTLQFIVLGMNAAKRRESYQWLLQRKQENTAFDRLAAEGKERQIVLLHYGLWAVQWILYSMFAFLAIMFGSNAISALLDAIPNVVMNGLTVCGGLLPAVGMAMLMKMLWDKKICVAYFFGFIMSAYLNLPLIAIAVLGVVIAIYVASNDYKMNQLETQRVVVSDGTDSNCNFYLDKEEEEFFS